MKKLIIIILVTVLSMSAVTSISAGLTPMSEGGVVLIHLEDSNFTDENIVKAHDKNNASPSGLVRGMEVLANEQHRMPATPDGDLPDAKDMINGTWRPNFSPDLEPYAKGYIDLKANYIVTDIIMLDTNGNQTLTINSGEPFNWNLAESVNLNKYLQWRTLTNLDIATRYLQLTSTDTQTGIAEIAIYGYKTNVPIIDYQQPARESGQTSADKAFGVNAFVDDPIHVSKVGGHIREFHNFTFTYSDKNYFSPSVNGGWDFDAYYKSLWERGIDPVPCIQGTNTHISGSNIVDYSGNEKPIPEGADPSLPESYAEHSNVMFNYAARYGGIKISEDRLNLGANQKPKTGLGYIEYYENFNEPNKDWEGQKSYLNPYEFAAMCSADYDGHEGKIGVNNGIKQADPNAKLVMGGLVGRNVIEYLNLMKDWFEANRDDKKFAIDVVNLHYYIKTAVVENTTMHADLKEIREWVDTNIPGVEVWVTEFGPEISKEEIQDPYSDEYLHNKAFATVRMFMAGYAAGMDRMTMFMLRDTESGVYSTDGLTTQKGLWQTKPSWHYMYGTRNALKDSYFDGIIRDDNQLYIYKFRANGRDVYALWTPGRLGETIDYTLDIGGGKSAYKTKLSAIYAEGVSSMMTINGGKVSLTVGNDPVFITVSDVSNPKLLKTKKLLDIRSLSGRAETLKKIEVLFDEQMTIPITPTSKLRGKLVNYELDPDYIATNPGIPEHNLFPISAIIDLGRDYIVTDVGYYDVNNVGDIVISAMTLSGEWVTVSEYGLTTYDRWIVLEALQLVKTRYIKVERYNNAACYEVGLYGYIA